MIGNNARYLQARLFIMSEKHDNYAQEWTKLGYPKGMGSSSFLQPPGSRYIRAYHMTSTKNALNDIENCWLKVALISEVNDPFELLGLYCHNRKIRKLTNQYKESQNKSIGLLCFCADWSNPVLWSHYASGHRGICLGFDLRRSTIVEKVKYEDSRIRAIFDNENEPSEISKDIQELISRTKSRDWEYEQELREIVKLKDTISKDNRFFWPFDENIRLAEVILGPRCTEELSTVSKSVSKSNPNAVTFKARLAFKSFRVVLDQRTKPKVQE